MSAQRISLKSKPLVAGVLALLAIVACVNVIVFKPGKRGPSPRQVRVQASQPVPADMGDFMHGGALPDQDLAAWVGSRRPTLHRDPFGRDQKASTTVTTSEPLEVAVVDTVQALVCNAILLGGARPAAVISGRSYRLGDTVREYEVTAIGSLGVKLTDAQGQSFLLPVNTGQDAFRPGRIVNGTMENERLEGTSLVEHARSERK